MDATKMKDEQKEPVLLWMYPIHDIAKCMKCGCRTLAVEAHGHFEPAAPPNREPVIDRLTVKCADCAAAWTVRLDLGRRGG